MEALGYLYSINDSYESLHVTIGDDADFIEMLKRELGRIAGIFFFSFCLSCMYRVVLVYRPIHIYYYIY